MKIDLSSLIYHGREWFVFQEVVSHLPKEKAAIAKGRSKGSKSYTSRLGIASEWVIGDRRIMLSKHGFIETQHVDTALIITNVLIVREHFEDLLGDSFNQPVILKVQQFTLTEKLFTIAMFEWSYDPTQIDSIKKIKLEPQIDEKENVDSIKPKPVKNSRNGRKLNHNSLLRSSPGPQSLKRRRRTRSTDTSCQSERRSSLELRPKRKKAKEARDLISLMAQNHSNDINDNDIHTIIDTHTVVTEIKIKRERLSSVLPRKSYLTRKESAEGMGSKTSQCQDKEVPNATSKSKTPPCQDKEVHNATSKTPPCQDKEVPNATSTSKTPASLYQDKEVPNATNKTSCYQDDEINNPVMNIDEDSDFPLPALFDDLLAQDLCEDNDECQDSDKCTYVKEETSETTKTDCTFDEPLAMENNNTPTMPLSPEISSPDISEPTQLNGSITNENPSPVNNVSPLTLVENIKQQLCPDHIDSVDIGDGEETCADESQSSSQNVATPKIEHNALNCPSVCSCVNHNQEQAGNAGATDLLDGLIATGFVSQVRQMLENINSDKETKVSQMDQEIKSMQAKISQKKKSNQQMQLNIRKKARELEKMFDNLRKAGAECTDLEKKCEALISEKSAVDAKLKKCLDVLNSIN